MLKMPEGHESFSILIEDNRESQREYRYLREMSDNELLFWCNSPTKFLRRVDGEDNKWLLTKSHVAMVGSGVSGVTLLRYLYNFHPEWWNKFKSVIPPHDHIAP